MEKMTLLKLGKKEIKMLEDEGYGKSYFSKGDMIPVVVKDGKVVGIESELGDLGRGVSITLVKPLDKKQARFALLDDMFENVSKQAKEFVDSVATKAQLIYVESELGAKIKVVSGKDCEVSLSKVYADGQGYSKNDDSIYHPGNIDVSVLRVEPRDIAKTADEISKDVEKYVLKLEKIEKIEKAIKKELKSIEKAELKELKDRRIPAKDDDYDEEDEYEQSVLDFGEDLDEDDDFEEDIEDNIEDDRDESKPEKDPDDDREDEDEEEEDDYEIDDYGM